MCARGAPCPPLQGTVQAPRTGGCIWKGSRREQSHGPAWLSACTEAGLFQPPKPSPARRPSLAPAIVQGRPFRPLPGVRTRKTNSPDAHRNASPHPLPRVHLPGPTSSLRRSCPLLAAQRQGLPGRVIQASETRLCSQPSPEQAPPLAQTGSPRVGGSGLSLGLRGSKGSGHHLAHLPFQGSALSELLGSGNLGWSRPGSLAGVTPAATTARDWGGAWDYRPGPVPDSGPSPQGPVHTTAAPTLSLGQRAVAQLPRLPLWMQKVS